MILTRSRKFPPSLSGLSSSNREKFLIQIIALMPLCLYLGRAIFYIDFFILIFLFFTLSFKESFRGNKFDPLFITVSIYFFLTFVVNIIPTKYSQLDDIGAQISVALMTLTVCYISQHLFMKSKNYYKNKLYAVRVLSLSLFIASFFLLVSYSIDINIIHSIKYQKIVKFVHSSYHAKYSYLSVGSCFLLFNYFKFPSFFSGLFVVSFFLAAVASQGRTAIITIVLSGIVYAWISARKKREFLLYTLIVAMLLFLLLLVSYISSGNPFSFSDIHSSARISGSIEYIKYINDNSPVLGLGLGAGRFLREQGVVPYGSPHNIFLDAFATMGWAGLIVFTVFLIVWLVDIFKLYKKNTDPHQRALLVSTFFAVLVAGQAYLSIWSKHNMVLAFFYFYLAISFAQLRDRNEQDSEDALVASEAD